jgi:hypothetical protein
MSVLSLLVRVLVCLSLALGSASPALAQARMHGLETPVVATADAPGGDCHHHHHDAAATGPGHGHAIVQAGHADAAAAMPVARHDACQGPCCEHGACSCDCVHMSPCTALATLLVARVLPSGAVLGPLRAGRPEPRLPGRIRPPNA